jgi:Concanavalin A-like lectin/glucanases superfamily
MRRCIQGLWLTAALAASCSFDEGNLRSTATGAHDGAVDYSAALDTTAVANGDTAGQPADAVARLDERRSDDLPIIGQQDVGSTGGADSGGAMGGAHGGAGEIDGGMGGMGGSGTGGVATGGSDGNDIDGGVTDTPGNPGPDSGEEVGVASVDPDLVLWYRFDESSSTTACDSAKFGGVARDATLATVGVGSNAGFSTVTQVGTHAVALAPANDNASGGGFVVMPTLHNLAPGAITIAVWLNLGAATPNQSWERVFDYADSTTNPKWFNLIARTGSSPYGPAFAISNVGRATADQQLLLSSTVLTANVWHHVAIVLPAGAPYTGLMYIDGAVVATNNAMTLHLSDIGATLNNWLGRSEFTADPYFNGSMDDFRVYKRALSPQEIAALMALR